LKLKDLFGLWLSIVKYGFSEMKLGFGMFFDAFKKKK